QPAQKKGGEALRRRRSGCRLRRPQVDGLGAARVRLDIKGHALAFLEAAHARGLNRCRMDEHVLRAAFRGDKSKAFAGIEKLHCSDSHLIAPYASGLRSSHRSNGASKSQSSVRKVSCFVLARN